MLDVTNSFEKYWSFRSRNQVEILSQRSILLEAVEECRKYVMMLRRDTESQENITELVFALKNNMDAMAQVLINAPTINDILCLVLFYQYNQL